LGSDGFWEQDYGWVVRVRRHLAHAEGAVYGTELGSVTLKRIGFFCFPIKHSTHTSGLNLKISSLIFGGFQKKTYSGYL
jgi:hypothetical protein